MKAKRILTAVLATAMTIGTGTIGASAWERTWWTTTSTDVVRTYDDSSNAYDYFTMFTNHFTTISYACGYEYATVNWDLDFGSSKKYAEIGFSKPTDKNATWAPGANTLITSVTTVSTSGDSYHDVDDNGIFCKTEISSKAKVGYFQELDHATVGAEYETLGFEVVGSIRDDWNDGTKVFK